MNLDVSMGIVGLLISLVYVAFTVLGLGILVFGLIVLIKVNRLLTVRLKEKTAAPVAGEPPVTDLSASPDSDSGTPAERPMKAGDHYA